MDNINLSGIGGAGDSQRPDYVQRKASPEKTASASQGGVDEVKISDEGARVSSLVSKVAEMDSSRPAVVQQAQEKVRGGNYPPPALVDGLSKLMGTNLQIEEPQE